VDTIYVYVDRALPPALAAQFTWSAYRSADNLTGIWTPVALTQPVTFNPVLLRFEIRIERTQARFLKVVTQPLPVGATTDPQFQEIFATELQFFEATPAELARGQTTDLAGNLNGTTRLVLVPDLGLAYDLSSALTHSDDRDPTWSVTNGLSLARRLDPVFAVAARVDRTDFDSGRGLESSNRWSGSLTAEPIPTFGATASYSGQLAQTEEGDTLSNSGTLGARADLYEGVAVNGSGTVSWARLPEGTTSRSFLTSGSVSLVPNRYMSASGTASYSQGTQTGGGRAPRTDRRTFLEASAALTPVRALALSGGVSRQFGGDLPPVTLATFSGSVSPFPGGDLQLRYGYTETFDSGTEQRARFHGPTARWNIRPGWHIDAGYALQDVTAPAFSQKTRAFNANLLITLR
jgi:hypothetical protein